MPDSNPGPLPQTSGALPMSHHISIKIKIAIVRTKQVEDLDSEAGVLAVLDELAEVGEAVLLGLGVLLNHGDDGVGNAGLVLQATLVPTHK